MGVDAITLDGDQPGTGVGRADTELDVLANGVIGFGQAQRQFGVALQRAFDIGVAGHAVADLVEFGIGGIADLDDELARRIGLQLEFLDVCERRQRRVADRTQPLLRDVFVQARVLPGQDRHIAAFDDHGAQALDRQGLGIRTDADQFQHALAAALDVVEVGVALDADQMIVARHQCAGLGRHIAAAARLEGAHQEAQLIGRAGEVLQAKVKHDLAVLVSLAIAERLVETH